MYTRVQLPSEAIEGFRALEVKSQVIVSHQTWVPVTRLRFSTRAVCVFNLFNP